MAFHISETKIIKTIRNNRLIDYFYLILRAKRWGYDLRWYNNDSVLNYCEENGEEIIEIEAPKDRPVCVPAYYGISEEKIYTFKSPKLYVAKLHNVSVVGGTEVILTKDSALLDAWSGEDSDRIQFENDIIRRHTKNRSFIELSDEKIEVDRAINLCGLAATNYYHFTIEIMSRLHNMDGVNIDENLPILIDERIKNYYQLEELLNTVNKKYPIIFVPEGAKVMVKELYVISKNTWMPFNVKKADMFRISDNIFAESGIMSIRECAKDYIVEQTNRKIFISRKNTIRSRIKNEEELRILFQKAGFEVVCTEDLSYFDQIKLFSSAKCVVGASGAALTNLIYCHKNTVFGCIIPREYQFFVYSTLGHLVGCKELFFNPKIIEKKLYISLEEYVADVESVSGYINELLKMCS